MMNLLEDDKGKNRMADAKAQPITSSRHFPLLSARCERINGKKIIGMKLAPRIRPVSECENPLFLSMICRYG